MGIKSSVLKTQFCSCNGRAYFPETLLRMNKTILSVNGVTKRFGGLVALNEISFDLEKGDVVGLMGPNGAGKTTLLNVIAGEHAPDDGTVFFKEHNITGMPAHRICHLGISRTYQTPQPFVSLTVRENLMASAVFGRQLEINDAEAEDDNILRLLDLIEKKDAIAGSLPILSLKRLELARALARRPDLLLLDEVAAGTTETEIPGILAVINEIRNMGITIIIIEHVMKVLMGVVDRIIVMDKGTKIAEDKPAAIMCNSRVIDAYFGA
jgi:branched-chain amino acid transport system ATP-binding protein